MIEIPSDDHEDVPEQAENLLARLADLLNVYGPDSDKVEMFLTEHADNEQFWRLGRLSIDLKKAMLHQQDAIDHDDEEGEEWKNV